MPGEVTVDLRAANGARASAAGGAAAHRRARRSFGELDIWIARAAARPDLSKARREPHLVAGGVRFAVWEPNAKYVSVIGELQTRGLGRGPAASRSIQRDLGMASSRAPAAGKQYQVHLDGSVRAKADPVASEDGVPPKTASVIFESELRMEGSGVDRNRVTGRSSSTAR